MDNMINIYWPVYKNLEKQFIDLMFDIHIDDHQLNVYSLKISDLILRAAIEIESISKDLYLINQGPPTKTRYPKYDEDCIKYLNQLWNLDKKVVIISSHNCFLSKRLLYPFSKSERRSGSESLTFGWNNAYQNIKHERSKNLSFASVKYLFEIMAALYVLNLYYKDENIDLGRDLQYIPFLSNLGSDIFSINYYKIHGYSFFNNLNLIGFTKESNFDESIYVIKWKDKFLNESIERFATQHNNVKNSIRNNPELLNKLIEQYKGQKYPSVDVFLDSVWGSDEYNNLLAQEWLKDKAHNSYFNRVESEAVLNKNKNLKLFSGFQNN